MSSSTIVVTGANGLVGAQVCAALSQRGHAVRAIVRRANRAPQLPGVTETVGDFTDPGFAAHAVADADAVVTTVHPMGSERDTQQEIGVAGTGVIARAAADAGVARLIHISTAAVYDRSPETGDVDERAQLVADDAGDYAVTKRDTDRTLEGIDGLTRVLLRPPAILGAGATSVWNTLRPAQMREQADARHAVPDATFAWVHVQDLAALAADLADGRIAEAGDPDDGPLAGGCTPVNVAAARATQRDYVGTVLTALGLDPIWDDEPAWTGRILTDRATRWGWRPDVSLSTALAEIADGLGATG